LLGTGDLCLSGFAGLPRSLVGGGFRGQRGRQLDVSLGSGS
jgi:hypothetical protein